MLRHWIPIEKLSLELLLGNNSNPMAISFLENGRYIVEKDESGDKSGDGDSKRKKMSIDSILEGFSNLDWCFLSRNPNAILLLEQNLIKIDWKQLSGNPNAISLLEQNFGKVDWEQLSSNPNIFEDEDIACK